MHHLSTGQKGGTGRGSFVLPAGVAKDGRRAATMWMVLASAARIDSDSRNVRRRLDSGHDRARGLHLHEAGDRQALCR